MAFPVPDTWTISGIILKSGVPFTQGKVYAYNLYSGTWESIAENGFGSDGSFSLTFSKWNFQKGDETIEFPTIRIRVYDYSGNLLWTSKTYDALTANSNIGTLDMDKPLNSGDCLVYGYVENEQGNRLSGRTVTAYCLHYDEKNELFVKTILGCIATGAQGEYEIYYESTALPQGLILDSKEDYGKDKVSLYAEVELGENRAPCIKHLVFNGKKKQEFNFTVKFGQTEHKCEYEELNVYLSPYLSAVYAEYGSTDRISALSTFLGSNTAFPLVAGRERLTEIKTSAYFTAHKIYAELINALKTAEKPDPSVDYPESLWCEYFFALVLKENAVSLYSIKRLKPAKIQQAILGAVSDLLICAKCTVSGILDLWNILLGKAEITDNDASSPTTLSINQLICLSLNGDLGFALVEPIRYKKYEAPSDESLYKGILDAYDEVGADRTELMKCLEDGSESVLGLSKDQISKLRLVFDLDEFHSHFADAVVVSYRYAFSAQFARFSDFLSLKKSDWASIVDGIAVNYGKQFYGKIKEDESAQPIIVYDPALPSNFTGTNLTNKKAIYVKTLAELIETWFPQKAMLRKLGDLLTEETWKNTCQILQGEQWEAFSLLDTDLDEYLKDAEIVLEESEKERIRTLARLFHLTESPDAIAGLIQNGFVSAYSVSKVEEDDFVALYGGALGDAKEARKIHRIAENIISEATLNIQAYAADSGEENDTLPSLPRSINTSATKLLKAANPANAETEATNRAAVRTATRTVPNWPNLFGKINYAKATEGQSVLSASAYFIDLLKFLKKGQAYSALTKRRPDILLLELSKANAEVSMPTIDLAVELLESLAARETDSAGKLVIAANNTLKGLTESELRAEPYIPSQAVAYTNMAQYPYPISNLTDFNRLKAKKLLANLSLDFHDVSDMAGKESGERILFAGAILKSILNKNSEVDAWKLWGLDAYTNSVPYPDKSSFAEGSWLAVLSEVSILLSRSGLTIKELLQVLSFDLFNGVKCKPKTAEDYSLANINGYELIGYDETFFRSLAYFLARRKFLGWTLEEINRTWSLDLDSLDVISELAVRYGISVRDVLVLADGASLSFEELSEIYQVPYTLDEQVTEKDIKKFCKTGLGLSQEDANLLFNSLTEEDKGTKRLLLQVLYRHVLASRISGLSLSELSILKTAGLTFESDAEDVLTKLIAVRTFADECDLLNDTSIPADFYIGLMTPVETSLLADSGALKKQVDTFVEALRSQKDLSAEDLKKLVFAEFGITEDNGETKDDEDFGSKLYSQAVQKNFGTIADKSASDSACYRIYLNLYRKVSLYKYVQCYAQGIDLIGLDFVSLDGGILSFNDLKPLLYANYTTDRLLSGEFDFERLAKLNSSETSDAEKEQLAEELAIERSDLDSLLTYAVESDYTSPRNWSKFTKCYELLSKTGALPSTLAPLVSADVLAEESVTSFETAIKKGKTKTEWQKFVQETNDELRRAKRDALAAYVCWYSCSREEKASLYPQKFYDETDIYSYYLLDVKMEPDMAISRIVQANACIQLFVKRMELGLEGKIKLTDNQKSEGEWMKNYRVWEAARKVFLYPENWISSDLREDKSPFFEELENRLQEISTDHDELETALSEYLEKIRQVSGLEIVGACKENGGDEAGILYTLHIIGRTRGEPHAYYYRTYKAKAVLSGEWTPWESLDVDIAAETVVPAILNQRLYLLWPQITTGQREKTGTSSSGGMAQNEYFAKIQLCFTSHTGNSWTGTQMTKAAFYDVSEKQMDFALSDNESIEDRYHFRTKKGNSEGISVAIVRSSYHYQEYEETQAAVDVTDDMTKTQKVTRRIYDTTRQFISELGSIDVFADGREVVTTIENPTEQDLSLFAPARSHLVHGVFVEEDEYTCGDKGFSYPDDNSVLQYIPGHFKVVSTNLAFLDGEELPFFYMDDKRTYFVQTVPNDGDVNTGKKSYKFELISHELVNDFYKRFRDGGTKWLYTRETEALPVSDSYYYSYSSYNYYFSVYLGYYMAGDWQAWDLGQTIFQYNYSPTAIGVNGPYPAPMVDFVWGGANAVYNWELFFFVPMLIAEKMIAEENFEEALLWLDLVFDPRMEYSSYERTKRFVSDLPKGSRYWKFLPFFANKDADKSIVEMLGLPTKRDTLPDRTAMKSLVDKWKNDPFSPHLIARFRPVAYQKYVIMKYLDALIGQGDREFSTDTTESVNLAVQFYLLAAELLGPKLPEAPEPEPSTIYKAVDLLYRTDVLGNAFVKYEDAADVGKKSKLLSSLGGVGCKGKRPVGIVESMFYFTVPRNEDLMAYWDTIADRLYKIRNSQNIKGVKRALSLFAPPIDPGMLVKASALGMSVDNILSASSGQLPRYRFRVMVKKALEIARDTKELGKELLAALEKCDAEELNTLRVKNENQALSMSKAVQEMEVSTLGAEGATLEAEKTAKEAVAVQKLALHKESSRERKYRKLMKKVAQVQETVEKMRKTASALYKIPDFKYGAVANAFGGPRFDMESLGGTKLAENLVSAAESYASRFAQRQLDAAKVKLQGELDRRAKEWLIGDTEYADAIVEVEKKQVVNEIKVGQAQKRHADLEKQITRSEEFYNTMSQKFTGRQMYVWLAGEIGKTYKEMFNLAVKVGQMAERCYNFEISGAPTTVFTQITGNYWNGMYKGLIACDKLITALHAMEVSYLENDKQRMTITRPISIDELGAGLLDELKTRKTSKPYYSCNFILLDSFFDNDFDGHTDRRLVDVRIEVKGPDVAYLNAELCLSSSFNSKTYATSSAMQIEGKLVFEFNSDVYNTFEFEKINQAYFRLSLSGPEGFAAKITDVILYVSYTAIKGV